MSFTPAVVGNGIAGWRILQAGIERQEAAFASSAAQVRQAEAFRERIGEIDNAADLVADRTLLEVALGAFGLGDDLQNRAFIQRILEDGASDPSALANRLTDGRYAAFAGAFGFDGDPSVRESGFADRIIDAHMRQKFEVAVGEIDPDMRLALSLDREMGAVAEAGGSEDAKWFTIMGTPPLRSVFERIFQLPGTFGAVDIDRQLTVFKERAESLFGSSDPAQFTDPEAREALTIRFLAAAQVEAGLSATAPGNIALQLLGAA